MSRRTVTLVGDGIENPHNARALQDAAALFGTACVFRDRAKLAAAYADTYSEAPPLSMTSLQQVRAGHSPVVGLENARGAASVYEATLPARAHAALIAGNERRGIAPDALAACDRLVQIPNASRVVTSLNVAAAAAVGLYYLSRSAAAAQLVRRHPDLHRPELLLLAPTDHVETGSAIRSAAALGWGRVLLEDTHQVWFGAPRALQAEARAAARRHKNAIHVVAAPPRARHAFDEVCVVTTGSDGVPLHAVNLARGSRQLVVVPDSGDSHTHEDWTRFAPTVRSVRLDLPSPVACCRYRLLATIALAEIARQVGRPTRAPRREARGKPVYDSALPLTVPEVGEVLSAEDLEAY